MKPARLAFAVLVVFVLFFLACSREESGIAQSFDWPQWRGPDGNGVSRETNWDPTALAGGPRVLWRVDVGQGYSNVVIEDNRLYVGGYDTRVVQYLVWCLDATTGRVIWRDEAPTSSMAVPPQCTPAVDGTDLFALSGEGILRCLNTKNGKLRWQRDLVADYGAVKPCYGFAGSPVIVGSRVILTANSAGMALDRKTGNLEWGSDPPPNEFPTLDASTSTGTYYSTPVIFEAGGQQYTVIAGWEGLSAVDVEKGKRLWLHPWGRIGWCEVPDPLVIEGARVVTFAYRDDLQGEAVLFRAGPGQTEVLWRLDFSITWLIGTPVMANGLVYAVDGALGARTWLRSISLENGLPVGKAEPVDSGSSACLSLTAADGKLIILSGSGILYTGEATPDGYQEISRCDLYGEEPKPAKFWTAPVLCNGRIYCRNFAGDLICIDVRRSGGN